MQTTSRIFPRDKQISLNSAQIMRHVCYALLPGIILQTVFFGVGTFIQLILALLTAGCCEGLNAYLRKRHLSQLDWSSAFVTASLLAVSVPAIAPWWLVVVAAALGLLLGKHVFGGVGMNIFNPALVGFCLVYLSFPACMSVYPLGYIGMSDSLAFIFSSTTAADQAANQAADALTGATQLASLKANGYLARANLAATLTANLTYWWLNAAWLAGGLYLWLRGLADWRLSLAFFVVFVISISGLSWLTDSTIGIGEHIGLGALIFTACFIITDPTTAASGRRGRIIYAALAGLLAGLIRHYSNMPDSMAFAVLLANLSAPMIDSYTLPQYNQS